MTATTPQPTQSKRRDVRPRPLKWHQRWAATLITATIKLLALTVRMRWNLPESVRELPKDQAFIICVWHNRLALGLPVYRQFSARTGRTPRLAGLVSASKDGSILARIVKSFDGQAVRGSSSRRGAQALRELTTWAKRGYDIVVTPDGPRGPRYKIQPGVISLAQLTGLPIVPVSVEIQWKWCLPSWDKFQVPIPGGLCRVWAGDPLRVERELSEEKRLETVRELERRMVKITVD